jgi:D-glycero-D-manno-heptose 1,7-bisphosphate phosphatase
MDANIGLQRAGNAVQCARIHKRQGARKAEGLFPKHERDARATSKHGPDARATFGGHGGLRLNGTSVRNGTGRERTAMRKCFFFDRDGIVNRSPGAGWVRDWSEFAWMPEFFEVFRLVRDLGFESVLVTNQSGISRGVMSEAAVRDIHGRLRRELAERTGLDFLDVLYCPHQDFHDCACRKPRPGMLLEAARRHEIDLAVSWMIGDQATDMEAGRRAGCRTLLVNAQGAGMAADAWIPDLAALPAWLRRLAPDAL